MPAAPNAPTWSQSTQGPAVVFSANEAAEFSATIAAGYVGAMALSQLGQQPVSATGALLQQIIHLASANTFGTTGMGTTHHAMWFADNTSSSSIVLSFLAMTLAIAMGVVVARRLSGTAAAKLWIPRSIGAAILAGTAGAVWLSSRDALTSHTLRQADCLVFALSVGALWGLMPHDHQTTARSALLRRAALGEGRAIAQLAVFAAVGYLTAQFSFVLEGTSAPLLPAIVLCALGLVAAQCAVVSAQNYISTWQSAILPDTPATGKWFSVVVAVELVIICFVMWTISGSD